MRPRCSSGMVARGRLAAAAPPRRAAALCRGPRRGRGAVCVRAELGTMTESFGLLLKPEVAAIFSTGIAALR